MPQLRRITSVWWGSKDLTKDSFMSPPAHPVYRVYGFAQLEQSMTKEISEHYKWVKMSSDWKPELTVTNLDLPSLVWSRSDSFTKDFMPPLIGGKLFFERQRGILYFDMVVEKWFEKKACELGTPPITHDATEIRRRNGFSVARNCEDIECHRLNQNYENKTHCDCGLGGLADIMKLYACQSMMNPSPNPRYRFTAWQRNVAVRGTLRHFWQK